MKLKNIFKYAVCILLVGTFAASCAERELEIVEDLNLFRCLEPMNLDARVSSSLGDVVTFSWDVAKDADYYELCVYTDEARTKKDFSEQVEPGNVPLVKKLTADKTYWFTVQAFNEKKEPSHIAVAEKSFKTFAVKDNLFMKVTAREATSVSLAWSKEVADFQEVTKIDYYPSKYGDTAGSGAGSHTLSAEEIAAASATIDGLTPSTEYTFTLYFLSASRGQVDAWTTPDVSGFTEVSTLDALKNAILTQGAKIRLMQAGSPYDIESLDITQGFTLVGEETADGTKPVLTGELQIADTWAGTDLYFEGVEFNGAPTAISPSGFGFAIQNKNGGTVDGKAIGNLTYKNCVITNYSKGIIYEWGKAMVLGDVTYDSCEISKINADGTGGGDVFDIRQATSIGTLSFIGNTITQGMRTFLRIDAGTMGALVVENNTVRNLNFVDNTNNAGFFGLQIAPGSVSFKNNLFIHMVEKAVLGSANAKYQTADGLAVAAVNNWFYDIADTYFTDSWPAAKVGASILADDPCYNSAGGYFNINPDSEIAGKGVGAPKWWTPYVEEPEDLTQNVIEGPHVWDLGNARNFSGTIKKQMVRDELLVAASETCPIVAADGMLAFTGATVTDRNQVPADGFMAFKVAAPGSVVARAAGEGTGHVIIATQPLAGGALIVKGGVSPVADAPAAQKIVISDISEPSWIYVYASGEVALAELAWSEDVSAVNTALPAPAPKADPSSFTAGEAVDVKISWDAVQNAASYSVVFSGKTYAVDGLEFTIEGKTTAMLDAGSFEAKVYANPSASDIYNTQSEAGVAAFAVLPANTGPVSDEFVVSSAEDLLNAIAAGKDAITLKYSESVYEIGAVTLNAPLHLKGQTSGGKMSKLTANFTLSGEIGGSVVLSNLEIVGNGASVLIDDKTNAPVLDTVAVYDSWLHGTKALYDNSGKAASSVQHVIFKGNLITDSSDGADYIDMRAGAHHEFVFENNTVANSCRTFVRTDAGHEMNVALIKNNTFYKVATNASSKDNNGILHIRSAAGSGLYSYQVLNNFFYSILIDTEPGHANGFPKFKSKAGIVPATIANNWFYNVEEREEKAAYSFFSFITREESTAGGGAVLPADPCKDAENLDFTLTNGVMMNAGAGDPRWNPMAGSTPSPEISVKNIDEFLSAVAAGKKVITLERASFDLTSVPETVSEVAAGKITLVAPLSIIAEPGARFIGGFIFKEGATSFSAKNVIFYGASTVDNVFEVADDNAVMNSFSLKDCAISAYKNRLFYMNKTGKVTSAEFTGNFVIGLEGADFTSGDFIDVRKGALTALKVKGNTFAQAIRTFARIDASVQLSSVLVENNTFYNNCYVDSKDNNGIFHVRATSLQESDFIVRKNIFAGMHRAAETPGQANGYPKLVSTNSASKIPTFEGNFYSDIETGESYSFWTAGRITEEIATAGYGVVLSADLFKDASSLDLTVVHALAASEGVGDPRWITTPVSEGEPFKVADTEALINALSAGKDIILLTGKSYDLTGIEGASAGVITLSKGVTLKGVTSSGVKPEVLGGYKLAGTEGAFVLENLRLGGVSGDVKVGNMVDIDASVTMDGITIKDCEIYGFGNRLISGSGESVMGPVRVEGVLVHDFGTSGDFIDFRKGSVDGIKVLNSTFWNGIRTFVRVDAAVKCGSVLVQNNTFFNLCSVDSKDNNGIMHVRSSAAAAPAALSSAARRIKVTKNIFASMHREAEESTASNKQGFPKLVSTASEKIAHPYITDNLFWDIDTAEPYSWWNTMTAEDIEAAGQVLEDTPFSGDTATGKFTVKGAWKGYGDPRW